jgi:YegS/Rv2252/BmrU family lipid kinase
LKQSVLLIHNPVAARTSFAVLESIKRVFETAGWRVAIADTMRAGDAENLARKGVAAGVDVVAVYGGDGTTIQAVGGMMGSDTALGLLPGGTGNLLAGNLRLPRSPVKCAEIIVSGTRRPIDLGRLSCSGSERYFSVGCGAGFDAEIMTGTTETAKRRFGMAAYVAKTLEVLGKLEAVRHRITIDGHTREVDATSVLVVNCGEIIPPILKLKKDISLKDGLLDVILFSPTGYIESIGVFWQMVSGRANGEGRIQFAQGRVVEVETERPLPVEMDGDGAGTTPFTAEVIPSGIEVFLPR